MQSGCLNGGRPMVVFFSSSYVVAAGGWPCRCRINPCRSGQVRLVGPTFWAGKASCDSIRGGLREASIDRERNLLFFYQQGDLLCVCKKEDTNLPGLAVSKQARQKGGKQRPKEIERGRRMKNKCETISEQLTFSCNLDLVINIICGDDHLFI